MSKNNDFIIEAVKGKPNSLTSIAFNTGVTLERERIIRLWHLEMDCDCEEAMQHLKKLIEGENK